MTGRSLEAPVGRSMEALGPYHGGGEGKASSRVLHVSHSAPRLSTNSAHTPARLFPMDAQGSQKALKRPTSLDATQNRQNNESHTLKKARLNGPGTFINPYASKSNAKHKPSSASGPSSIPPNRTPLHRLEPGGSGQVGVSPTADYHAISHPPSTIEKSTTQLSLFSPTQIQASSSKIDPFLISASTHISAKNSNQSLRFASAPNPSAARCSHDTPTPSNHVAVPKAFTDKLLQQQGRISALEGIVYDLRDQFRDYKADVETQMDELDNENRQLWDRVNDLEEQQERSQDTAQRVVDFIDNSDIERTNKPIESKPKPQKEQSNA
ncbi:hypothetical protein B0H14DRAFT_2628017 [Mycena olivaceomarginata]|nr:hypothetical protein B0H14DRAFT_2628017 [Mycena olivaceomarginata]